MKDYPRQLIEVDWTGALTALDAIQSFLVEHPTSYYMAPNRQWLFYLTRKHGLLQLVNDFSTMSKRDIGDYIMGVLELMDG
jgi:hypothetical protein